MPPANVAPRHLDLRLVAHRAALERSARSGLRSPRGTRSSGRSRWPANVLSNHDQPRHASRFAPAGRSVAEGDARAKVAAAMLLTLRGTPFLYYGEEIGQRNLVVPNAAAFDPPARRASLLFPWWNRDQCRGPMRWRGGPGGGFTTGRPWLPLRAGRRGPQRRPPVGRSRLGAVVLPASCSGSAATRRFSAWGARSSSTSATRTSSPTSAGSMTAAAFVAAQLRRPPARPSTCRRAGQGRTWRIALSTHDHGPTAALGARVTLKPLEALIALDG